MTSARRDEQIGEQPYLFELFELGPRLTRFLDSFFQELTPTLTFGQYRTLRRVAEGYTTLTAIGQVATLSLPAISATLDVLVRKGLLRRRVDGSDRRSTTLALTRDGRRIINDGQRLIDDLSASLLEGVSDEVGPRLAKDIHIVADRVLEHLRS